MHIPTILMLNQYSQIEDYYIIKAIGLFIAFIALVIIFVKQKGIKL